MKLIDILVQELPKRGGWPDGVYFIVQDYDGEIKGASEHANLSRWTRAWIRDGQKEKVMEPFKSTIAEDEVTAIITREQYEAALKKSVWGDTGLPPVGVEFEYGTHRTRAKCLAIGHHMVFASKGDPDDEDGDFEEFMISIQDSEFHEVRSKRDEAVHTIAELCRSAASNGHSADLIYDAIAAGKITGVKLSD